MEITTSEREGAVVIAISGRLDAEHAERLKTEFRKVVDQNPKIVFDLSGMDYLDSTGLGAIVFCLKSCNEHNGKLKLACLADKPRMIFEITRAYRIFDIYDDLDQALLSF
ncbi:MAG: STAS domain-containing protein [Victivallaceae bacterium]|nr:STAS domain-containing protein [Victivallaceae bacterium]